MLNTQGRVACLAMANIAMVERLTKTIWTPPVEEGVRPGYQRGEVLRMLSKQGWRIAEVPIELEELSCEGREVFGLNSLWGVRPVRKLDRVALLVTEHDLPGA